MNIIITDKHEEMDHWILKEICPVCEKKFEVEDSIEIIPIQKSKTLKEFTSVAIPIHTSCYYIE